ncbi:MAG: sugar transferase [Lachnospirales bacterium]
MNSKREVKRKSGSVFKVIEAFVYLIIVNISYIAIMQFDHTNKYQQINIQAYEEVWFYITIGAITIFLFNGMFSTLKLSKTESILVVLTSTLMIVLVTTALAFIVRSFALPRTVIFYGFVIQTVLISIVKIVIKTIYDKTKKIKNVAIYCEMDRAKEYIVKILGNDRNLKERLIFVSDQEVFDLKYIENVDKVYICSDEKNSLEKHMNEFILRGIEICVIPKSYELALTNSNLYLKSNIPMLKIDKLSISEEYKFVKRFIDIILSSIAIFVLSPFMIFAAILIYATDGGKPIFKQKRVTLNNKVFTVYKFRTMVINAEKSTGAVWAAKGDPRITKTGAFLRKYWLDELPQLFNILKGDMSIVGPRPERPELVEEFVKDCPDFKFRTYVKCGLTGYAQVMAEYDTIPQNKLKYDLYYILNTNLFMDLNIILLTIRRMVLKFIGHKNEILSYEMLLENWKMVEIINSSNIKFYSYKK